MGSYLESTTLEKHGRTSPRSSSPCLLYSLPLLSLPFPFPFPPSPSASPFILSLHLPRLSPPPRTAPLSLTLSPFPPSPFPLFPASLPPPPPTCWWAAVGGAMTELDDGSSEQPAIIYKGKKPYKMIGPYLMGDVRRRCCDQRWPAAPRLLPSNTPTSHPPPSHPIPIPSSSFSAGREPVRPAAPRACTRAVQHVGAARGEVRRAHRCWLDPPLRLARRRRRSLTSLNNWW